MIRKQYLVLLGALSAALAACGSEISGPGPGMGTSGSSGSTAGSAGTSPSGGSAGNAGGGMNPGGSAGSSGGSVAGGGGSSAGGGGTPVCVPGVPASSQIPRMTRKQYDQVLKDLLGIETLADAPSGNPASLLVEDFEGAMTDLAWNAYQDTANKVAAAVMAGTNKTKFIDCDPAQVTCLTDTIRNFGRKAFRRPLTETEVSSFLRLNAVTPPGTPNEVAEAILYTFLASPSFIMIPELKQDLEGPAIKLSGHEVAARLSFFLWNSVPDEALSLAADNGELATQAQILAQAQRMVLDRPRVAPVVSTFHRAWADIRLGTHWDSIEHDSTLYPKYNAGVRPAMMAELDRFFEEVAFQDGSFQDLFLSSVAYVNRDTAPIYGLDPASYGSELVPVTLDAAQRPGFLTRVGFLASFSSFDTTSPILRGAYITRSILGIHVDDPPEEAAKTPIPEGDYETYREMMTALTSGVKCVGCHAPVINPSGFVLELYDSIGGWQTTDPLGGAIDPVAQVILSEDADAKTLTSPVELMNEIAAGASAQRRYAEHWVKFATRRAPNPNDACEVDLLSMRLTQDGYGILDVLTDLTQADSFRLRTVGN